jgi:hypothetical protein
MEGDMKTFFNKITLESCKESASKFNSRFEWRKSYSNFYAYAMKNGWLNECCEHMKKI